MTSRPLTASGPDPTGWTSQSSQRELWREMGLEPGLFRAHLVKELKDLEQLKPQKLLSELTPLGISGLFEKSELLQALRKVRLWQALPAAQLQPLLERPASQATKSQLLSELISQHFGAPRSRHGNIFETKTSPTNGGQSQQSQQSFPRSKMGGGRSAATPGAGYVNYASGIGSQAFRSNLAAQNIPQKSDLPQWPRSDIPRRVPDPPAARSSPAPKAAPPQVVAAFRALLLDPTAKEEEVKKSFRRLAKQYHPDKQAEGVDLEVAKERFQRIKTAYETCMDFLEV
ncbi:unnamed protein product [Durusdinium trenchii]|uniref:J domain-containing protein n=1 Tax=Durusdinium trenchii TaxID=1381693 RepID=A0ABP0IRY5_9DINO